MRREAMLETRFDPPDRFEAAFDQAHETAAGEAGAADFGEPDYRPGLAVLLQAMDYDARFTETGRRIAWGQVVTALAARARATAEMNKIPDLDALPVPRPLVITGIPRSGTTALHRLLALDPQFQGLQTWLTDAPMPRPPREAWDAHPMFQRAVRALEARFAATPDLRAAHNMIAEELEECIFILGHSFCSNMWTSGWTVPSYDAWWQAQSEAPAYRYAKRVVQLIGSSDPRRRWLLKNPGHIDNLDLLFASYPDACVVQTHRDPAKAVPSLAALLVQLLRLLEGPDRLELRARMLIRRETAKWAKAVRNADRVRERHAGQVMDVVHADFHADPIGIVRRIYAFAGLELTHATETAMRQRAQEKPELSHGAHRYDLADFGMSAAEVRDEYGDYVARYDLIEERPA
jgi:hypothetical protein